MVSYLSPLSICKEFISGVTKAFAISTDADKRIKEVQIGGNEMKIINFADDTAIKCLIRKQLILK